MKKLELKLLNMRKAQEFSCHTAKDFSGQLFITIQSNKSIGRFYPNEPEKGLLNVKGCYFPHLSKAAGAVDFDFTPYVEEINKVLYKSGDRIGLNIYMK